jgi:hypothetical protein
VSIQPKEGLLNDGQLPLQRSRRVLFSVLNLRDRCFLGNSFVISVPRTVLDSAVCAGMSLTF